TVCKLARSRPKPGPPPEQTLCASCRTQVGSELCTTGREVGATRPESPPTFWLGSRLLAGRWPLSCPAPRFPTKMTEPGPAGGHGPPRFWRVAEEQTAGRGRYAPGEPQPDRPGVCRNSRLPAPSTSGWTNSRYSSTRSCSISVCTRTPLPRTAMVPSPSCFRSLTEATTSPPSTCEPAHSSLVSVLVTTYFGVALRCAAIGLVSGSVGGRPAFFGEAWRPKR